MSSREQEHFKAHKAPKLERLRTNILREQEETLIIIIIIILYNSTSTCNKIPIQLNPIATITATACTYYLYVPACSCCHCRAVFSSKMQMMLCHICFTPKSKSTRDICS
jgi:hypothetical protein